MPVTRPDWNKIYEGQGSGLPRAREMVMVTRETARLAQSALGEQNARDYYHNYGAAQRELIDVLAVTAEEKAANLRKYLAENFIDEEGSDVWRPIESAPKDDTQILAVTADGRIMIWAGEMLHRVMTGAQPFHLQFPATHWMPLPHPPLKQ